MLIQNGVLFPPNAAGPLTKRKVAISLTSEAVVGAAFRFNICDPIGLKKKNKNKIPQGDVSIFSHLTFVASQQFIATQDLSTPGPYTNTVPSSLVDRVLV